MSTTSTTTASVAHDQTLGDDPNFANHICVLTIARGDGTLFNADSLLEEDIVKLCVGMGQVHPDGIVWLTAMELVIAFHSSEEMLAAVCLITSAIVWHDYPIRVHTRPSTAAQIWDYVAVRDRWPCSASVPIPEGGLIPPPLPSDRGPDPNSI